MYGLIAAGAPTLDLTAAGAAIPDLTATRAAAACCNLSVATGEEAMAEEREGVVEEAVEAEAAEKAMALKVGGERGAIP